MKCAVAVLFVAVFVLAKTPAWAQDVDLQKAVICQALAQQFGDSIKAAKADDDVKKAATGLARQGDLACNSRNYDTGIDQLHQALQQVSLKPSR